MVKIFGNNFEKLCWKIQREMRHNRKPILLLFGNGYESQIVLLALQKLHKKFTIIHAFNYTLCRKTRTVLKKFKKPTILFQVYDGEDKENKTWSIVNKAIFFEKISLGLPFNHYVIVTGFQMGGDSKLIKAFHQGMFENMYSPLLRYPEEFIQTIYQDMIDNEPLGKFLWQNNESDSLTNIEVY